MYSEIKNIIMKKNIIEKTIWVLLFMLPISACEDLVVEELNNASLTDVLSDPNEWVSTMYNSYDNILDEITSFAPAGLNMGGDIYADYTGFGGRNAIELSKLPREPLDQSGVQSLTVVRTPWNKVGTGFGSITLILRNMIENFGGEAINKDGDNITEQVYASGYFIQGIALGFLGLLYDQGPALDETVPLVEFPSLPLFSYDEVVAAAVSKLESSAALFDANSELILQGFDDQILDNTKAATLARNMSAMFLAYKARNESETEANDWSKILELTNTIVDSDPISGVFSFRHLITNGRFGQRSRLHQRMVNMLAGGNGGADALGDGADPDHPTAPYPYPEGEDTQPEIIGAPDARLGGTLFPYSDTTPAGFKSSDEGYHNLSSYKIFYDDPNEGFPSDLPLFTVGHIQLLRAEAMIRSNQKDAAQIASWINQTRVDNGGLAPITGTESDAELLKAIYYEKLVEYSWYYPVAGYLFRRMTTVPEYQLQPGTVRHLPIPITEANILGIEPYTFGGIGNEQ